MLFYQKFIKSKSFEEMIDCVQLIFPFLGLELHFLVRNNLNEYQTDMWTSTEHDSTNRLTLCRVNIIY